MLHRLASAALLLFALLLAGPAAAAPGEVLVRLNTALGPITIALDMRRAPITAKNFLAYVDEKRFDGTSFYRAAPSRYVKDRGIVQGGIDQRLVRARLPIKHEPTSKTGLRHVDGTVSMARNAPGTAGGNFFIIVGGGSNYDAKPGSPGYAAFGRVVAGMEVVRRILYLPKHPGGYTQETKGQSLVRPVPIVSAVRVR